MFRCIAATVFITSISLQVFAAGSFKGKVTDNISGRPVPGALLSVSGTGFKTHSDYSGNFEFNALPAGEVKVVATAQSYFADTITVTIEDRKNSTGSILLKKDVDQLPMMRVVGQLEGQTKAFNIQKTADNIKNVVSANDISRFPDQNSAEALQRVTGISVTRDQGEGRYVQIRGSKSAYTSVNVNGVSIPAPEGSERSVALDVIPSDVLAQIEVTKVLTPEMDGDAIGGSVSLQTRKATSGKLTLDCSANLGYNALTATRENGPAPLNGQGSLTIGKRFGENGNIGLLAGASYMRTNRGSDNSEFSWDDDDGKYFIEELELRDYSVTRDRLGIDATFDVNFSETANLSLSGLYNRFGDHEYRRRTTLKLGDADIADEISPSSWKFHADSAEPADDRENPVLERQLKDRYEVQDIIALNLNSEFKAGVITVTPRVAWSFAQENEPDAFYSTFETDPDTMEINFSKLREPTFTSTTPINDAGAYELDAIEREDNVTSENNIEGAVDLLLPLTIGSNSLEVKAGGKARRRSKMRDNSYKEYGWNGDDDVRMDMVAGDYKNPEFHNGVFPGSADNFQDPQKIRDHFDNNRSYYKLSDPQDLLEDNWVSDYEAEEDVVAGYLQAKLGLDKLMLLGGVRCEYTGSDYRGYKLDVDLAEAIADADDGRNVEDAVSAVEGYKRSIEVLPMFNVKFSPIENLNIRAAYTRSFSRPDFYDLVPYYLLEDDEAEMGNSDLENTQANNGDIMLAYYFKSLGVLSAGFFVKSLSDIIYTRIYEEDGIEITQPVNGETARLYGVELTFEKQLSFLPSFLNGFGIGGNYTYCSSEAEVVTVAGEGKRTISMPGQSNHIMNAFFQYEKYGLSARIAANYHSEFIEEVGEVADEDRYYADHLQLDLSFGYKVLKERNLYVFAEFLNLTNEPLYYYSKIDGKELPLQQEYYSWWCHFGIKYSF
jgi:TonB-dependent receptor